jgi:hypothetical protein
MKRLFHTSQHFLVSGSIFGHKKPGSGSGLYKYGSGTLLSMKGNMLLVKVLCLKMTRKATTASEG